MIYSSTITAVSPKKWDDSFEGYFYRYIDTLEGKQVLKDFISSRFRGEKSVENEYEKLKKFLDAMYNRTYAICFTTERDIELLWRANSKDNKTIMFETSSDYLEKLVSENEDLEMFKVEEIQYDLENNCKIKDYLKNIDVGEGYRSIWDQESFFLHKRKLFMYEKEYRLIGTEYYNGKDGLLRIQIPIINELISGVMIHPAADDYYVELVRRICDQLGLKYYGKSEIYDFQTL